MDIWSRVLLREDNSGSLQLWHGDVGHLLPIAQPAIDINCEMRGVPRRVELVPGLSVPFRFSKGDEHLVVRVSRATADLQNGTHGTRGMGLIYREIEPLLRALDSSTEVEEPDVAAVFIAPVGGLHPERDRAAIRIEVALCRVCAFLVVFEQ